MTILEKVKIMIGVDDTTKDSLLSLLIDNAQAEFKQHTNQTSVPTAAENIIVDMVVVKYNLIGTEGLSSSNFSGASESYEQYSAQLKNAISRYKKARFL